MHGREVSVTCVLSDLSLFDQRADALSHARASRACRTSKTAKQGLSKVLLRQLAPPPPRGCSVGVDDGNGRRASLAILLVNAPSRLGISRLPAKLAPAVVTSGIPGSKMSRLTYPCSPCRTWCRGKATRQCALARASCAAFFSSTAALHFWACALSKHLLTGSGGCSSRPGRAVGIACSHQ